MSRASHLPFLKPAVRRKHEVSETTASEKKYNFFFWAQTGNLGQGNDLVCGVELWSYSVEVP